ncbi:MAG TPA: NAD(P)/FAD-dependent oxidoreductase, partial [Verrucomicrobiae bacterium]|nr:NAD(P)/FAD-dependent oxidoreductase [Verrucomicrobiae bacterium]
MELIKTEVVVLGAGPGGYAAAFYAADKGKKVLLVEMDKQLGGVCLTRGCIPSKALLHATKMITEARDSVNRGISFGEPKVDLDKLRAWKNSVVEKLAGGVASLAKLRGVTVLQGRGYFEDSKTLRVETADGQKFVNYESAIIAVGSKSAMPKAFDLGNPRIMTSREALEVPDVPEKLLIVGGGYIGMELGTVYAALGSKVVVVEALGSILTGADADLIRPVQRYAEKAFQEVRVKTKVVSMSTVGKQIKVVMEADGKKTEELYDRVLVSVGRVPNHADLGLGNTKIAKDERGFIKVND